MGSALEHRINSSIFQVIDAIGIYLQIGQISDKASKQEAVYQARGGVTADTKRGGAVGCGRQLVRVGARMSWSRKYGCLSNGRGSSIPILGSDVYILTDQAIVSTAPLTPQLESVRSLITESMAS
jgi:hypothetical protein